jgi:hypothetical protein
MPPPCQGGGTRLPSFPSVYGSEGDSHQLGQPHLGQTELHTQLCDVTREVRGNLRFKAIPFPLNLC